VQYEVKNSKRPERDKTTQLHWRIESIYKSLDRLYGTQGLILKASQLDAIDLMSSEQIEERLLALHRLLKQDPTIMSIEPEQDYDAMLLGMEEKVAELLARQAIEEEIHERIQQKMNDKYNDYLRDIKLEVLKEHQPSPENAQTLKKYGKLEKMESTSLSCSALEILRPSKMEEIIGQLSAKKSLLSKLNTPFPQHIILYGPPGVGKTTCARLALEMVKGRAQNPFHENAPFIEVDGTTLRWDPRESTNPLLGSVHDPIYQGARKELAEDGIPEPKPGLVSEAHGGILFIDEIGEMDPLLQNKLLKVLEDKRVYFESSYYDSHDERIPRYIKQIFEQGIPADFVLIGATTRSPAEISPALRSRCMEIFFDPLSPEQITEIVKLSAGKLQINIESGVEELIGQYITEGRSANKLLVDAYALALNELQQQMPITVTRSHVREAILHARITPPLKIAVGEKAAIGKIFGLGAWGYQGGLIEIEAIAFPAEKPGEGTIRFNDTAGSMARDSVFNAASVLRKETGENLKNYDIHINIIGGANVDGPSAGAAIYLVILSAIRQIPIYQDIAITGELSIQGRVKPIGALHEKTIGACRSGVRRIIIPSDNLVNNPLRRDGVEIIPINNIDEALPHIFLTE
jgi:ATP-dependent Lon protease